MVTSESCRNGKEPGWFAGVGTTCPGDLDDDGIDDACESSHSVPATSTWGSIILALLIVCAAKLGVAHPRARRIAS